MDDRDSTNAAHQGSGEPVGGDQPAGDQGPYRTRPKDTFLQRDRKWMRVVVWLLGIIFPLVVLGFELALHWCEEVLFDPLPSGVHIFLVALVPLANLFAQSWEASIRFAWLQRALNGAALVVTLIYSLVFLPLLPVSLIAIVVYGLGFLSLSPMFALFATLVARRLIANRTHFDPIPKYKPRLAGALAAASLFVGAALPHLLTQHGLRLATSSDARTAQKGREFLSRFSSTDHLRASCARDIGRHRSSPLTLSFLLGDPAPAEKASEVFYRVTGQVCQTRAEELEGGFRTRGFETVAEDPAGPSRAADVQLASSRFDASVDPRAAVAYLEWTLVLRNVSGLQQEARAELDLPKGSVISRASLWIDGEPREAAFASRAQATEAYERVVSRRKDPLLVTNTGRGRAQFRCFPVPPHGEMKILIGITAPLAIENPNRAVLGLPSMLHRNFSQTSEHQLWVEAKQPFQLGEATARGVAGGWAVDQTLPPLALEPAQLVVKFDRNGADNEAWSPDPTDEQYLIEQSVESYREPAIEHVSIVLDSSVRQQATAAVLRAALADFAPGAELSLLVAGDADVIELVSNRRAEPQLFHEIERGISLLSYRGGVDNVPALTKAIEHANQRKSAAVLWLHGPQPYLFEQPERARQVLERAVGRVRLFELQTTPGRNRVVEALVSAPGFTNPMRMGDLDATLRHQFKEWSAGLRYRPTRQRVPRPASGSPLEAHKTSSHLVRLWAYEEVERLASEHKREEAIKLASAHKLVTSVSGAVVLETAAQYAEAGLVPPTADNVPSVPEPAFWALIGCALAFLLFALFYARRLQKNEPACS
jgi:hypothetical protein